MSKLIICERCHGEISNPNELVTATVVFQVVAYHNDCYVHDLKGPKTILLANEPINSFSWNLTFFVMIIASVLWLIFAEESLKWLALIGLFPIGLRLVSYFRYERHSNRN